MKSQLFLLEGWRKLPLLRKIIAFKNINKILKWVSIFVNSFQMEVIFAVRTLYTNDIKNMMKFIFEEAKLRAEKNKKHILQNVRCDVTADSCLLSVEFSHFTDEKNIDAWIKEDEVEAFNKTVALFLAEMKLYTDDFIYVKSYICGCGYIVFRNSKDIQVKKSI